MSYPNRTPAVVFRLPEVKCRVCRHVRYDDGTRCEQCGSYENRNITFFGANRQWRDRRYEGLKFLDEDTEIKGPIQ
jgi:hypothetical protein